MKLLKARKDTRKKIEYETIKLADGREIVGLVSVLSNDATKLKVWRIDGTSDVVQSEDVTDRRPTYDEFQKAVLDGLQLAYKVTANSLYGQCGAKTSSIYMKEVAASCTAVGRGQIIKARDFMIHNYPGVEIIYGDTDSLFVKFPIKEPGEQLDKKERVKRAWDMGCDASSRFKAHLKAPHDLEMEKVMYPMILLSKKRYIAYKHEGADAKPKLNSMGVVLKRRDNAGIVKTVYGGIIDIILNDHDIKASTKFLKESLENLIAGKCDMSELTITKSLKSTYKDPEKIAHKVLADRMKIRDPGNAPQTNDRIPFVYIQTPPPMKKGEKILQGERIEHPEFIRKNNLKIDYEFYITNQIMQPVSQIYALTLENLDGYNKGPDYFKELYDKILKDKNGNDKKARERWQDLREAEVKKILFDPHLIKLDNKKKGNREITEFFSVAAK